MALIIVIRLPAGWKVNNLFNKTNDIVIGREHEKRNKYIRCDKINRKIKLNMKNVQSLRLGGVREHCI